MGSKETEKGQRYIDALDDARCDDKWDEVPELIRKVSKHAPHRKCLIQCATAENHIVAHVRNKRPATAKGQSAPAQVTSLNELIPPLLSAIDEAQGLPQDIFQAQVCLGWVHWTLSEPALTVARLPKSFDDETIGNLSYGTKEVSRWTEACAVKGCYMKGTAQKLISASNDAFETITSILPRLAAPSQRSLSCPKWLEWSERLLALIASTASEKACSTQSPTNHRFIEIGLKAFRLWAAHPYVRRKETSAQPPGTQPAGLVEPASQASVWMMYYGFLSTILQRKMTYEPPADGPLRTQLANEIRRVEARCENVFLREVRFPRANATNPQVDSWVEQVIRNWEVICGSDWKDAELGEGGPEAVGRNVLDILYRAATKTYHSHLILRRLFHVHASLAEFDLAMKALDSYVEIVVSAKDRAEKAAEIGELEDDAILLQTISEGILLLSCFGSYEEAEKAKGLVDTLETYLEKCVPGEAKPHRDDEKGGLQDGVDGVISSRIVVSPIAIAMAYRAIGIGLANWSRWTPVNESRDDIRNLAIEKLEKSLEEELGEQTNLSGIYALAVLHAESRNLDTAIDYVKSALETKVISSTSKESDRAKLTKERDLVPLWHLLALLLSAKQRFDVAGRACEAAFEQFPGAVTIFGPNRRKSAKHRHDGELSREYDASYPGKDLLGQLRGREKERILETRMTQLALIEVTEGPDVAVNHSDQLLSLFATLFEEAELEVNMENKAQTGQLIAPKTSSGKSFRESIFGRKKVNRLPDRRNGVGSDLGSIRSGSTAHAPKIHVTDEDNSRKSTSRANSTAHREFHKLQKRDDSNPRVSHERQNPPQNDIETPENQADEQTVSVEDKETIGMAVSEETSAVSPKVPKHSAKQQLPPVAHNMPPNQEPPPAGHTKQPPEQDVRLPQVHRFESPTRALTRFPSVHSQKHAICVLIKIWLLIGGLYRRASLFEDAHEACEEATKLVTRFESLVGSQESSARAFTSRSWAINKSSDELWADVYAERGALLLARSQPHEALEYYEAAVLRYPDHLRATVGVANLLLDVWDGKLTAEPPQPRLDADLSSLPVTARYESKNLDETDGSVTSPSNQLPKMEPSEPSSWTLSNLRQADKHNIQNKDLTPDEINRLAARDRAYGLLSALTKAGSSWDDSEAWFALSRAYEASGQIEKMKDVLWWCVELEDRRPIRHWWNLGAGGYVL